MGSFVFSAPAVANQPQQSGARAYLSPNNTTATTPTNTAVSVTSDDLTIALINVGTLDNAASLAIQCSLNGSGYYPLYINGSVKTWTGAQINAGVIETIRIKALYVRFVLTPGTTTGSNGVQIRILD